MRGKLGTCIVCKGAIHKAGAFNNYYCEKCGLQYDRLTSITATPEFKEYWNKHRGILDPKIE